MDFNCIEALLGLPEFRVIDQVLGPQQLALHLERRDTASCVPGARHAAPRSRRADRGVSVTCPSWSAPSCCGCI